MNARERLLETLYQRDAFTRTKKCRFQPVKRIAAGTNWQRGPQEESSEYTSGVLQIAVKLFTRPMNAPHKVPQTW